MCAQRGYTNPCVYVCSVSRRVDTHVGEDCFLVLWVEQCSLPARQMLCPSITFQQWCLCRGFSGKVLFAIFSSV